MIFVYVIFIKRLQLMIKSHDYDECQSNREIREKKIGSSAQRVPSTHLLPVHDKVFQV